MASSRCAFSYTAALAVIFFCFCIGSFVFPDRGVCEKNEPSVSSGLVPPLGSSLRKEVLNALRREMIRVHGIKMVFRVRYLKVKDGWAWIETLPQSPDGSNQYEDVSALLNLQGRNWQVVEMACAEEENPDCLTSREYFVKLTERFPKVPIDILPIQRD
jgi:hypothetical protein